MTLASTICSPFHPNMNFKINCDITSITICTNKLLSSKKKPFNHHYIGVVIESMDKVKVSVEWNN